MTGPTLLVASGDRLFAGAVRAYLERRKAWVVGVAHDGLQALGAIGRQPPSAVLVLRDLPRLGPAALARQVRRRWPEITVVVLGEADTDDAVVLDPGTSTAAVVAALSTPPAQVARSHQERPTGVELLRGLTPRERVILKMLAEGLVIRDIGVELGVSQHTVRTHMQNLYAKLGLHSRLDVVRFAAQHGLVGAGPEDRAG